MDHGTRRIVRIDGRQSVGGRGLTEDEVRGKIFGYNFAGHDTRAITVNWTLYLLATNPEVQDWVAELWLLVMIRRNGSTKTITTHAQ